MSSIFQPHSSACRKRLHKDTCCRPGIASEGFETDGFVKDGHSGESMSQDSLSDNDLSCDGGGNVSQANSVQDTSSNNGQLKGGCSKDDYSKDSYSMDSKHVEGMNQRSHPQLDRSVLLFDMTGTQVSLLESQLSLPPFCLCGCVLSCLTVVMFILPSTKSSQSVSHACLSVFLYACTVHLLCASEAYLHELQQH